MIVKFQQVHRAGLGLGPPQGSVRPVNQDILAAVTQEDWVARRDPLADGLLASQSEEREAIVAFAVRASSCRRWSGKAGVVCTE